MNVNVNKNSPQTQRYWRFVVDRIVKSSPLHAGDIVRFTAKEDSPYFPEFSETPVIMNRFRVIKHQTETGEIHRDVIPEHPLRQEVDQIWDENSVRDGKMDALIFFTERKLDGMCVSRGVKGSEDGPIVVNFTYKVIDPIKIYREANRLEIKVLRGKNLSKYYTAFPSEWLEDPPRVRWGITEIEFTSAPLEQRICRIAYEKAAGVPVNCYEAGSKLDLVGTESDKKMHDTLFSGIKRINKSVKNKTGKELFCWENNGFYRRA